MNRGLSATATLILAAAFCMQCKAEELCVIGWNLQSGDSSTSTLRDTLLHYKTCHLFGFSEVLDQGFVNALEEALDENTPINWHTMLGTTGGEDRLAVVYDPRKLIVVDARELIGQQAERGRAPLTVTFELRQGGRQFVFMVNHLYRGDTADNRYKRLNQSEGLNRWVKAQSLPVIAVGDYNYDLNVNDINDRDSGFNALTGNGVLEWVQPGQLIGTQCSAGISNPTSVLDFVFVSGEAKTWGGVSEILESDPGYCPDNPQRSDHRPVRAVFQVN